MKKFEEIIDSEIDEDESNININKLKQEENKLQILGMVLKCSGNRHFLTLRHRTRRKTTLAAQILEPKNYGRIFPLSTPLILTKRAT